MWATHPDYEAVVTSSLKDKSPNVTHYHSAVHDASLIFNKHWFGNIFKRKQEILKKLDGINHVLQHIDSTRLSYIEKDL